MTNKRYDFKVVTSMCPKCLVKHIPMTELIGNVEIKNVERK